MSHSIAFRLPDNIDTDQLAPGQYMKGGIELLAAHCLETVRPDFAQRVKAGDVIVAGRNFGAGSSREQAAEALVYLGVRAVIAESFAGIFYRNAINLGLPVMLAVDKTSLARVNDGDSVSFNLQESWLEFQDKGERIILESLPENLRQILDDGGLIAHLKKRFERERQESKS